MYSILICAALAVVVFLVMMLAFSLAWWGSLLIGLVVFPLPSFSFPLHQFKINGYS